MTCVAKSQVRRLCEEIDAGVPEVGCQRGVRSVGALLPRPIRLQCLRAQFPSGIGSKAGQHRSVIPPQASSAGTRYTDRCLDEERAEIAGLFGRMEHFRDVVSRFDISARRCRAFVRLVADCVSLDKTVDTAQRRHGLASLLIRWARSTVGDPRIADRPWSW
jgi:hypothetical protein